ncbi:MAG TPA: teichoic acid ABC transporter ATP-binding protein, partial [Bacteroides sp.]|nr:teichoic acid ABC transporter ATP-binding protein [Bacteroides sp.]
MENEKKETKPAIIVNNVSMRFKISTGNVSGLKE